MKRHGKTAKMMGTYANNADETVDRSEVGDVDLKWRSDLGQT